MSFAENLDGNNQKKELTNSLHQDILRLKTFTFNQRSGQNQVPKSNFIPDYIILALAHKIAGNALFARQ